MRDELGFGRQQDHLGTRPHPNGLRRAVEVIHLGQLGRSAFLDIKRLPTAGVARTLAVCTIRQIPCDCT